MKVLFAVSDEKDAEAITRYYQKEYKEIISSKTVYYFNAIIKELQKDKTYDRVVISEDLELIANDNYQAVDKFIFDKMDTISDEATNAEGNDIPIILLGIDRRTKNDPLLIKLFGLGLYNVLIGQDRSVQKVCSLIYRPRTKKEAKAYYKVEAENVSYNAESKDGVSESEIQNIINHYKRIGDNIPRCVQSFDSIVSQYNEEQIKLIIEVLPNNVKVILEENSDAYRKIMGIKGKKVKGASQLRKTEYVEKEISSGNKLTKPVIIPSAAGSKNVNKVKKHSEQIEIEARRKAKQEKAKAEAEAKRKEEERIAKEKAKAEAEAKRKEEERIAKEKAKAEAEAKRKEEERIAKEKAKAEAEAKRKEEERKAKEKAKAEAEAKKKEEERKAKEKAKTEAEAKRKKEESKKNATKDEIQTEKRGRGRPRKNSAETVVLEDVPVKKKRGRPRKNSQLEDELKDDLDDLLDEKIIDSNEFDEENIENDINKYKYDEEEDLPEFDDYEENDDDILGFDDDEEIEEDDDILGLDDDEEVEEEDDDILGLDDDEEVEEDDDILGLDDDEEVEEDDDILGLDDEEDDEEDDDILGIDDDEEEEDDDILGLDDDEEDEEDDDILGLDDDEEDEEDDDILGLDDDEEDEEDDDILGLDDDEEDEEDDDILGLDDDEDEEDDDILGLDEDEEDDDDILGLDDEEETEEDDDILGLDDDEEVEEDDDILGLDEDEEVEEDDDDILGLDDDEEVEEDDDNILGFDDDEEAEEDDDNILGFDDDEETEKDDDMSEFNNDEDILGIEDEEEVEDVEDIEENEDILESDDEDEENIQHNGAFKGITNRNYKYDSDLASSIKDLKETEDNTTYNFDTDNLITADQKIVAFIGTTKNGTSFIVNNLADLYSNKGIKTAILDLTKNKNSYYIYTNNEEGLREKAHNCFEKLINGIAEGVPVNKNLTVFTSLPGEDDELDNVNNIIKTLLENYTIVLLDCDFETDVRYFKVAQEIYLIQSLDVLTIQPLTAFLRELKVKNILDASKLRVVINKNIKVNTLNEKLLIGGMSVYNDPAMTYMTELFDRDKIKYTTIPFEEQVYVKYLDGMVNCQISSKGYSKNFITHLNKLSDMVYPTINAKKAKKNYNDYSKNSKKFEDAFSKNTSSTLDKMRKKY